MAENGTSFEIGLQVPGADQALAASSALQALESSLRTAESAASAASAALKQAEASYATAESAADSAAKALERATLAVDAQKAAVELAVSKHGLFSSEAEKAAAKLARLEARQSEAAAAAEKASAALAEQTIHVDALRRRAVEAAAAEGRMGEAIAAANKAHKEQAAAASAAAKALEQQKKAQADAMKSAADAAAKALEQQKRAHSEALKSSQQSAKATQKANKEMLETFGAVSAAAAAVAAAIAIAAAAAALGIAKIAMWGVELADTNKLIPKQLDRISKNFKKLFSGLKIDGVVKGLEQIGNLFDENAASGRAIKVVFESIFQPLIDGAVSVLPKIIRGFLQFQILVLKGLIALKQVTLEYGEQIRTVGEAFKIALIIGAAFAAVIVGVVIVAIVALAAAITVGVLAIKALGEWIAKAITTAREAAASFFEVGSAIVDGMVKGIQNGAAAVVNAVKGVASGAINAAKSALKIASPSKVFEQLGEFTGEGMQIGVEGSSAGVQSALETMASPPEIEAVASGGASPQPTEGASGGNTFIVQAGSASAPEVIELMRKLVVGEWQGLEIQAGLGEADA